MSDQAAAKELAAGLDEIEGRTAELFAACHDEQSLRAARARVLGPEGSLTTLLSLMPRVPGPDRKPLGKRANDAKKAIESLFERALAGVKAAEREKDLQSPALDVTLPGRDVRHGRLHPITRTMHALVDVFTSMGFDVADGPEVETHQNNFDRLGFPPDHPATDMQDSFFVRGDRRALLRTHTSNMQVREMMRRKPPMAVCSPGQVYRRDDDVTHSPMFFQIEAFVVDRHVSMAHLRGTIRRFCDRVFAPGVPVRMRPSYFPFVEPGGEVDVGCTICDGWRGGADAAARQAACRVCKGTGFLEILGCGMIHPVVFEACGIAPEHWTGFALGMGIDRTAMLRHDIRDIRLLYENDVRFLNQL